MIAIAVVLAVLALAFANGANDNFKGVATLEGCGRVSYRRALALATLTTLAGSLSAIVVATGLARRFSGRGLVPDAVVVEPVFVLAVALGLAAGLRPALRRLEAALPPEPSCLCAAPALEAAPAGIGGVVRLQAGPTLRAGRTESCERHGARPLLTLTPRTVVDAVHVASAGAVGFARRLNDTPKIAGLLIALKVMTPGLGTAVLALAMAFGGLVAARRVARTLAFGITGMNGAEGLSANLVTASLVVLASPLGLPVSTTHVSCGALFGIGAANGEARWGMIAAISAAWAVTLPVAAACSAAAAAALSNLI
jgi:PiT family inorganic phosphate transporter